ncbi:MAG: GAF and ANTAR domain-containing protein [Deltaproteobacteria bacterium]|nr:GAF and ANTAR domain-containing protein [Deltaproteobacteria bacterium]MBW2660580.1 GAF and ANTAR domain-containing protein [Deltaproteobacteria bacterium]
MPETHNKYIKALMDISSAITSDLYLEDILKLIVMVTARVTGVKICSLWLIDESVSPKMIRLKASQTIDPNYVKDRLLNMNEGVVGFVATSKCPLIVRNVLKEPRFKEKNMARKLGLVSMISVPLQVQSEKVIGVLNCFTARPHAFSKTDVNMITAVANQAAVAIINTELMVKTRIIQEELETRKLVGRAKEILMQCRNKTGIQAYRWMQKRSMDTRKSMREVAEAILLSEEFE